MNNSEVSVGNWLVVYILMCLPFINLIMLLVWAFGSGAPASQSNWAKATLIWMVISAVIVFVFFGAVIGSMA